MFNDGRILLRRRFDPLVEAVAVKANISGLSLEGVRKILEEVRHRVSKKSIRRRFLEAGGCFQRIK